MVNNATDGAMFEGFIPGPKLGCSQPGAVNAWAPIEGHSRLFATA
ncbi:MAG TPA: hypothetical protein VH684_26375 [Xanthobacteraceae bacterium]|jgi:hypothetical protein